MQQENTSIQLSVSFLAADDQLVNLFNSSDNQRNPSFLQINKQPVDIKNLFNHLQIKQAEIQKGYASDELPEKRQKNKKIKKRKMVVYHKIQSLKDRATTKFYIQSLQNRIQQLKMQVERLKNLNKVNIEYIKKINDSELIMSCFFQHRQKIIEKLQKLTNAQNPDSTKIEEQCKSLIKKQGCYGEERIKAIQHSFKQLASMMTTNCHKYMAEAALKNTDLFNPASIDTWESWRKELFLKLNLSPRVLQQFSQKREEILGLHRQFNKKLLEMYKHKCNLLQLGRQIETHYDQMGRQLTPLQKGRLVCFLQKYKFQGYFYNEQAVRKMYQQLSDYNKFSYQVNNTMVMA